MSHKTFTHKDLAKQLGVSETTVKSYRRKFPGCIPLYSHGKPIRFNHDALAVCKKIRDLFEQGMSIDEVRSRLALEFSWIEPVEKQASSSEEFKHVTANVSTSSAVAQGEQKSVFSKSDAFVSLPQSFTTAISGLAKSVVALTRQQSVILERIAGLEEKIAPQALNSAQTQAAHFERYVEEPGASAGNEAQKKDERVENFNSDFLANPKWADDLASRLEGMEQALVRTLASFEEQLGASGGGAEVEKTNAFSNFETASSSASSKAGQEKEPASPEHFTSDGAVSGEVASSKTVFGESPFKEKVPAAFNPNNEETAGLQDKREEEIIFSDINNSSPHPSAREPEQELVPPVKNEEKGRVLPWNDREGGGQKIVYQLKASIFEEQIGQTSHNEKVVESPQSNQPSRTPELVLPVQPVQPVQGEGARFARQQNQNNSQFSKVAQVTAHRQEHYNEDFLRHISGLPLAVSVSGEHVSLSGRAPFSLNDLKAILAQTFSPPEHYVGRWETASGECWYILEQPEVEDGEGISLHLRPVLNRRNVQMLELVRFMVGGVCEHPSSLYTFVQDWLG